jgi:hypothetical protein
MLRAGARLQTGAHGRGSDARPALMRDARAQLQRPEAARAAHPSLNLAVQRVLLEVGVVLLQLQALGGIPAVLRYRAGAGVRRARAGGGADAACSSGERLQRTFWVQ